MGHAVMGTASASGENRAIEAAKAAINSPLIESGGNRRRAWPVVNITGSNNNESL